MINDSMKYQASFDIYCRIGAIAFLIHLDEYGIDVRAIDNGNPLRIFERLMLCSFTDTSEKTPAFKHLMR
ncbi:MAG: hypothetical protein ACTSV9_05430 [Candidatus Thorarchaeota archaeon]